MFIWVQKWIEFRPHHYWIPQPWSHYCPPSSNTPEQEKIPVDFCLRFWMLDFHGISRCDWWKRKYEHVTNILISENNTFFNRKLKECVQLFIPIFSFLDDHQLWQGSVLILRHFQNEVLISWKILEMQEILRMRKVLISGEPKNLGVQEILRFLLQAEMLIINGILLESQSSSKHLNVNDWIIRYCLNIYLF